MAHDNDEMVRFRQYMDRLCITFETPGHESCTDTVQVTGECTGLARLVVLLEQAADQVAWNAKPTADLLDAMVQEGTTYWQPNDPPGQELLAGQMQPGVLLGERCAHGTASQPAQPVLVHRQSFGRPRTNGLGVVSVWRVLGRWTVQVHIRYDYSYREQSSILANVLDPASGKWNQLVHLHHTLAAFETGKDENTLLESATKVLGSLDQR